MSRFHQGTATTHVRPHTTVDHRPGGLDVDIEASSAWIAVGVFDAKAGREPAVLSSVETMIEQFARERPVPSAFVMASRDGHRVVAFLWLAGHDAFRALQSAWDQHHLHLAREDKAESMRLALCHCTATSGDPLFEIGTTEVVTFEEHTGANAVLPSGDDDTVLGRALLVDDVAQHSFVLSRFSRYDGNARRYAIARSWGS
ncbi:MAG TPA: hypothetical protein VMD91_15400 [Candidatus Sulfotelmatobacter sp.]|nr:hypothetical protein [Candidatus Sulfotelmatobacter sp.]